MCAPASIRFGPLRPCPSVPRASALPRGRRLQPAARASGLWTTTQRRGTHREQMRWRCAAKSDGDGMSWKDIGNAAASLAKQVARKVGDSAQQLVPGGDSKAEGRAPAKQKREVNVEVADRSLGGMVQNMVGGLAGRMVGGLIETAMKPVFSMMEESRAEAESAYNRAVQAVEGSTRVQQALGGAIRCTMPMSQASSSSSINGRVTKQTRLTFQAVASTTGRTAQVQVQSDGMSQLNITVLLPDGSRVDLDGNDPGDAGSSGGRGSSPPGGVVVDAEWKEL